MSLYPTVPLGGNTSPDFFGGSSSSARERALEAIAANPGATDREIASSVGISAATVCRARRETARETAPLVSSVSSSVSRPLATAGRVPDGFDWGVDADIVIASQPAIAVYFNVRDEIVIRQEDRHGGDDACIFVTEANVPRLISRLRQIVDGGAE